MSRRSRRSCSGGAPISRLASTSIVPRYCRDAELWDQDACGLDERFVRECPEPGCSAGCCVSSETATVTVPADDVAGVYTGIDVRGGGTMIFDAPEEWCRGGGVDCSDANGTPGRPIPEEEPVLLEGAYLSTLIGRVGQWYFRIGASAEIVSEGDGPLFLMMNDRTEGRYYRDNRGSWKLTSKCYSATSRAVLEREDRHG